ncbi:MAG: DNA helicase PcrA [Lachnospiraceae bacterium]|nr:DNA helicase PcrA [Lachnospiraceae bacterium]
MTSVNTKKQNSRYTEGLNDMQRRAVEHTDGPLLILAGAGSGKTKVLVHRIARLIDEEQVPPGSIMAITFTNKAADEMRTRVDNMVGFGAGEIWVSTFHSSCVRILRRDIEQIGYGRYFSIYDTDDQLRVMKDVCKSLNIDTKYYREKSILHAISRAKDELIDPDRYEKQACDDFEKTVARAYRRYQETLFKNNALDFDDLLVKTVELFRTCPEVLAFYQEKFRYILVDEYQDTNTVQFVYVSLLAGKYGNLCVVGDDDQSIYRFRGANITNILSFEEKFPDAEVVRLEQNYRSTQNILDCANEVIRHNRQRKTKKLWTGNEQGEKVRLRQFENGFQEAEFIADEIARRVRRGEAAFSDHAVLYRTNAQSRLFEEKFIFGNIPYRVVGGVNFYSRMEIKDVIAYLKTIENAQDALAVRRIINVPRRGIGAASLAKADAFAEREEITLYEALGRVREVGLTGKAGAKIEEFTRLIETFRDKAAIMPVAQLITELLEKTGYLAELEAEKTEESEARIENLNELISKAASYDETSGDGSLAGFLEEVALIADIDTVEDSENVVLIMTLHASKGLEFPYVYIAGMEDGVFPGYLSIDSGDDAEMEEERRLAYVGITRAKKLLTLTAARQRMMRGNMVMNPVSRFVRELPRELVDLGEDRDTGYRRSGPQLSFGNAYKAMQGAIGAKAEKYPSRELYGQSRGNPYSAPKKQFAVKGGELGYAPGDRVVHMRFGGGVVKEITQGGRDYEVTVEFDRDGIKKMFASFANLKKE